MNIELVVDAVFDYTQATSHEDVGVTKPARADECSQVYDPWSMEMLENDCCDDLRSIDSRLAVLKSWIGTLPLGGQGPRRVSSNRYLLWFGFSRTVSDLKLHV
jgi:hypothetical protein